MKKRMKGPMGLKWRIENDKDKREEALLHDFPVRFEIIPRHVRERESMIDKIRSVSHLGKKAVREHDDRIRKYSEKHNVDPDLVRSVMFAENARGHHFGFNLALDQLQLSKSALPMNIQKNKWAYLAGKNPEDMYDPDVNIEAGAILLRRIADRIDHPTPEKVGSIWNYAGREKTNEFGEYIGRLYNEKPWKIID